jgi:hypothetical protein
LDAGDCKACCTMVVAKYPRMRALFVCRLLFLVLFLDREKRKLEIDSDSRERAYWFFGFVSNIPSSLHVVVLVGVLVITIIIIILWMITLSSVFLKYVSISFCSFVVSTLFLNAYELLSKCRQVGIVATLPESIQAMVIDCSMTCRFRCPLSRRRQAERVCYLNKVYRPVPSLMPYSSSNKAPRH